MKIHDKLCLVLNVSAAGFIPQPKCLPEQQSAAQRIKVRHTWSAIPPRTSESPQVWSRRRTASQQSSGRAPLKIF